MILLTNELSRKHPGLNAGSLGTVVQLPKLRAQQRRMDRSRPHSSSSIAPDELGLGQVVLDQVCAPTTEQLQRSLSALSLRLSAQRLSAQRAFPKRPARVPVFPELRVLPERPVWLAIPENGMRSVSARFQAGFPGGEKALAPVVEFRLRGGSTRIAVPALTRELDDNSGSSRTALPLELPKHRTRRYHRTLHPHNHTACPGKTVSSPAGARSPQRRERSLGREDTSC